MQKNLFNFVFITTAMLSSGPSLVHAFSDQNESVIVGEIAFPNDEKSLLYLTCGYLNLMSGKYQEALDDYQKVSHALEDFNDSGIEFLSFFGAAVASDNLNLKSETHEFILQIRALIDNAHSTEDGTVTDLSPQINSEMADCLRRVASLASVETQDLLNSYISEIFPQSLSNISLQEGNAIISPLSFWQNDVEVMPCKSFWKRVEGVARRIARAWNKIYKIYKEVREVEDDIRSRFEDKGDFSSAEVR